MNDTISREAAIELAMQYCPDDDGTCSKADEDIRNLLDELEDLPSVQPEQTCEYWDSESKFCSLCRPSAQPEHEYTMEEFMYEQNLGSPEDGSL